MKNIVRVNSIFLIVFLLIALSCEKLKNTGTQNIKEPEFRIAKCEPGVKTKILKAYLLHPPLTFNPIIAMDQVSKLISSQITSTLYRFDPVEHSFEPGLAISYDRDKSSKIFIIHLRSNITFSNGSPFTADDVKATVDYILKDDVHNPLAVYFNFIEQKLTCSKIDDHTIQFTCQKPISAIEPILSKIPVLPARMIAGVESSNRLNRLYDINTAPKDIISIGPYMIKSFIPEEKKLVLERNPQYWVVDPAGRTLPYIQEVLFTFAGTSTDISRKFLTGEADIVDYIDPAIAERLTNIPDIRIFDMGPSCSTYVTWFNLNSAPDPKRSQVALPPFRLQWFQSTAFRQGIARAINQDEMVAKVFRSKATPIADLLSPLDGLWTAPLKLDTYSITSARQKFIEAGLSYTSANILQDESKNPVQFNISVLSNDSQVSDAQTECLGVQIETAMRSIGIKATMLPLMYDLFYKKITETSDYDMAVIRLDEPVQPFFLKELLYSRSAGHFWFPNEQMTNSDGQKKFDLELNDLYYSTDWTERYSIVHRIQEIAVQYKFFIPLVKPHALYAAKGKIHNLKAGYATNTLLWNLEELFIPEE